MRQVAFCLILLPIFLYLHICQYFYTMRKSSLLWSFLLLLVVGVGYYFFKKGMRVPDHVIMLLCDDNWGNVCRLPNAKERKHPGGWGMYYHVDYVGAPRNSKWLNVTPIQNMWEQLQLTYDYGVEKLWILNVGDLKPMEYPITLFMDMAWNLDKVSSEGVTAHLKHWLERELGTSCAKAVLPVMQEHNPLAHVRKPEFMGNTREEEKNPVYRVVKDLPWSEREINERLNAYSQLSETVEKAASKVPADRQSAYFELVKYPVQAAAQNESQTVIRPIGTPR